MVAIVTDGASGIGRFITEELLMSDCRVAITSQDADAAEKFQHEAHQNGKGDLLKVIPCDMGRGEDVIRMVEEAHRLFILTFIL